MSETERNDTEVDRPRIERQLRNVRLKLVTARRELQTLLRQSGLRQDAKHMRVETERAERKVRKLEETEADLVKTLEPQVEDPERSRRAESAEDSGTTQSESASAQAAAQAETEGDSDG